MIFALRHRGGGAGSEILQRGGWIQTSSDLIYSEKIDASEVTGMASRTMKRRIFCGSVCEQIVYQAPDGLKDARKWDAEKNVRRERFQDPEQYRKFKENIARRKHYRKFMANFAAGDLFSTLTFNDEWECTEFAEAKKMRNNWRRQIQRAWPDAVFFIYLGRGKSTHRIHMHMVSHGIPQEWIEKHWKWGRVKRIVPLRKRCKIDEMDCGQDYQSLANYLFNHWTPEQGGHRYFFTKNAKEPEAEDATEVKVRYGYSIERPPVAPKGYRLTLAESTEYGYLYFRYVVDN